MMTDMQRLIDRIAYQIAQLPEHPDFDDARATLLRMQAEARLKLPVD